MPKPSATTRLLAATLALLVLGCSDEPEPPRWNVVVVTLDTTRADYLSCYGVRETAHTPTMDELATLGVRFARAQSVCSVTPVSHASILTGLYQYHHGLRVIAGTGGFHLPEDVPHLGEILQRAGWTTIAVHSAFPVSSYFGFDRAFDRFDSVETEMQEVEGELQLWDWQTYQRRSDETVERAMRYLGELRAGEPFFLWLHLWDPHDMAKLPPEEYIEANEPDEGWREEWPRSKRWLRRYEVEVQYMDEQLGRLVKMLRQRGEYGRTLFVVTADHGEGLGEHDWLSHRLVYQEQIEVPLILKWPGGPEGVVVDGVASSVDVLPTVLELLGLPFDASRLDGESLVEAIGTGRVPDRITYADQINGYDTNAPMVRSRPKAAFLYSVSDGRWKLIWRPNLPHLSELFDLESDPEEQHNLFGQALEPQRRLARELAARGGWVTAPIPPAAGRRQTDAALDALGALGYTGEDEELEPEGLPDGALVETDWVWGCAEHLDVRRESRTETCPECGAPLLLRTRTPISQLPPE